MPINTIQEIIADEILASRGRPTVRVVLSTVAGEVSACVPSVASTGSREAGIRLPGLSVSDCRRPAVE